MSSPHWVRLVLLAVVLGSSGWLAAQPPRKEEEEDPPAKEKDKARPVVPVPVAEPDKPPAAAPADGGADVGTFKEEMARADHPAAKELFKNLLLPYDRLKANFSGGATFYVELLEGRELPDGEVEVKVLTRSLKESTPKTLNGSGYKYTPFELIVLEEVDKFRAKKTTLDPEEQLDYAARAVASGLRWHLGMVEKNKRVGRGWDLVARQLRDRHLALWRERFQLLVDDNKLDKAAEVGARMLTRYENNNDVLRDVYGLNLRRVVKSLKAPTDAELAKLRESVLLYERLPGVTDKDGLIANARKRLTDRATALVAEAKALDAKKMTAAALAKLRQAEALDPDAPAIGGVRAALRGKVLYVGVRKLPERMSPATAETDAEKWAVELMFEGLLQPVPDPKVIRYRPELADALPAVMPLGRSFTLPKAARWAGGSEAPADARDVRGTLDLLRRPALKDRWCSEGVDVFEEIDRIVDPYRLRLAYRQGVLEPLGRATFKVIPAQWLQEQGRGADDDQFARKPFGTGPFVYAGVETEGASRECAVFRVNPHYGERQGKIGLPWVKEVRFFVPDQSSLAADVAGGQLHIYPDPPADLIPRFRNEPGLKDVMRVSVPEANRRVHILAINHRQAALQSDKFRQGLSAAINREAILKELFRAGDEKAHAALTGPFPVKSWATPPTAKEAPLYKPGAGGLMAEGLGNRGPVKLKVLYQADDPKRVADAQKDGEVAKRLKTQIEAAGKDKGGKALVEVDLVGLPPKEFNDKVHLEFGYDLALTTFDYRDDLYSLAGLLDPEAVTRGGRNYLGYLAPGTNPADPDRRLRRLIEEVRQFRDFTKQVKDRTWDIHALFNQRVPFVPLWQLDRYLVSHRDLEVYLDNPDAPVPADRLDPGVVFTGVEMWRVK